MGSLRLSANGSQNRDGGIQRVNQAFDPCPQKCSLGYSGRGAWILLRAEQFGLGGAVNAPMHRP
jgi:hypothetical protein